MKIKVKKLNPLINLPSFIKKGDWVDLEAAEEIYMRAPYAKNRTNEAVEQKQIYFNSYLIPLGIAMQLPEGYEAIICSRSSSFKKWGIIQTNSIGVIDNSYCSNEDEWKLPVIAFKNQKIKQGERVCQFRVQLSQKASMIQKIKWLLDSKIEFEECEDLNNEVRGGFGSTGV